MRTIIKFIGVTDKENNIHAVKLRAGVNIITGRSSTGKSALIEIFDYCFGSKDFTIPEGVITKYAEIYFVVLKVDETTLVLARSSNRARGFFKEEANSQILENENSFKKEYFAQEYFLPINDFLKELRSYFGSNIQLTDVDESLIQRQHRGKKKGTPSIRSFTSFMLQHQNLVANKHAIFYRFDEKEKREQVIDHFKIFAGIVDQKYFLKKQELERLELEKRKLELQLPKKSEKRERNKEKIEEALIDYETASGKELDLGTPESIVQNPQKALDSLKKRKIEVVGFSNNFIDEKEKKERRIANLTGQYRKLQNVLKDIKISIEYAERHEKNSKELLVPDEAMVFASSCPFCKSENLCSEHNANKLSEAINWLNTELESSKYALTSFREAENKQQAKLQGVKTEILAEIAGLKGLDTQIEELEKYKTQYELAMKAKIKIENLLDSFFENEFFDIENRIEEINNRIKQIKGYLKKHYDVEGRIKAAEIKINSFMKEIAKSLDFEKSYKPMNLNFSLETFDLWNDKKGQKVFLRSMGSGANWLSCHITLFLALNRYFCSLKDKCSIPTTLFFDQPSQVYFPSILDDSEEFEAEEIAQKEGKTRKRSVDEDIQAVIDFYSEFLNHCKRTFKDTGIEPQIIITDHADNLILKGFEDTKKFEELVADRRWRSKDSGFIKLSKIIFK